MNAKLVLGLGILLFVTGCGGGYRTVREPVPPRVDLHGYQTVGLVTFSTNSRSDIDRVSTASRGPGESAILRTPSGPQCRKRKRPPAAGSP